MKRAQTWEGLRGTCVPNLDEIKGTNAKNKRLEKKKRKKGFSRTWVKPGEDTQKNSGDDKTRKKKNQSNGGDNKNQKA